jgi:hypothetical protein
MALDPSISLQAGKIPQSQGTLGGIERGMKLQQLAIQPAILEQQLATARQAEQTSRAAQMTSEAQLPGVRAQAEGLVRGERQANQRIAAAQAAIETDDSGMPVLDSVTGQPKFNLNKYQHGLYKAGLVDEATKTGENFLRQSKDVYEFAATARTQAALAAQAAYDRTPGTPQQKQKAAEATWTDMSGRAVAAAQAGGFPLSPDQLRYTPGLEKALYTAAINPQAQESLKLTQAGQDIQRDQLALQTEQFENSKKVNFTDEDSLNPNSGASITARNIIQNITGQPVPENMSAGDLMRNPTTAGIMSSTGAAVGAQRAAALGEVTKYESVSKTLERAKTKLSTQGLTPFQFLEQAVQRRLLDDPELAALYSQLKQLPPGTVTEGMNYNSLKAITDAAAAHARANASVAVGGGATGRTEAPKPTTPAGGANTGKFTVGKIYTDAQGNKARWNGKSFEEVK